MQEGEKELSLAHLGELGPERLFHLDDHFRPAPERIGAPHDAGTHLSEFIIRDARPEARPFFDQNAMAGRGDGLDRRRREGDAVLVLFDLGGQTDNHGWPPSSTTRNVLSASATGAPPSARVAFPSRMTKRPFLRSIRASR